MEKERKIFDEEDAESIVTLEYENDESEDFFTVAVLDYKGKWYALLQPLEKSGAFEDFEDDELVVYEIREAADGDGDEYEPVLDGDLQQALVDELNKLIEESDADDGDK